MSTNQQQPDSEKQVNFGHQKVSAEEKTERVSAVFRAVAKRYDVMNDIMSLGSHRIFKRMVLHMSGIRQGANVLDLAGGTGDMAALFADAVGTEGAVMLADLNEDMMRVGRDRLLDQGLTQIGFCRTPAESLPFANQQFDCACVSFGLRNFTDKDLALRELLRVLKPGAALLVLEFSKPTDPLLEGAYKAFQTLWPPIGRALVGDAQPYQYLVDSIHVHPDQKALRQMFTDAGFVDVEYHNLLGGIAAIHRGCKPIQGPKAD